jgi:Fe-S-cluster containining protein
MPLRAFGYACLMSIPSDRELVQILDAALADASRRSGAWLVCHVGCTQCCIGAFAINQLDAQRLRDGLLDLKANDPLRAADVERRAADYIARLAAEFPGDPITGILADDEDSKLRFEDFANEEPCPALDPSSGRCDLYDARPTTCRVFGPPIRSGEEGGLGVCDLCFHGASAEEIAACEMQVDPDGLEATLLAEVEQRSNLHGNTLVAYCLKP